MNTERIPSIPERDISRENITQRKINILKRVQRMGTGKVSRLLERMVSLATSAAGWARVLGRATCRVGFVEIRLAV
jgi:hypothetical protein